MDKQKKSWAKGKKFTAEHRKKISEANIGHVVKPETRLKLSLSKIGKKLPPFSDEHRRKISESQIGRKLSDETRKKMSIKGKAKKLSEEHKKKIGLSRRGKNTGADHYNWKGGITPENEMIRHSLEYRIWRKAVFERDNYTCIWGGKEHGNKLHADHIKPFCLFPELRFAIDNGRTLCEKCHRTTNTYGNRK